MCDVSDGLVQDLGHIADTSRVGVELDLAALAPPAPLRDAATELGVDPMRWVLAGGDDHALVACVPPTAELPAGCSVIGRVVAGRDVHIDGRPYRGPRGHDHFGLAPRIA
jgi:thiamine-monophosphate kinase